MKIVGYLLLSLFACSNLYASKLEAYTTIGLGGLHPQDKTKIITYVPGLTLLYDLSKKHITVRKHTNVHLRRKYIKATTHNGIELLLLDEEGTLNRKVDNLDKFDFLISRAIPVCRKIETCLSTDIWKQFDAGRRGGNGWYTVWPRQGGKFLSNSLNPDTRFWNVKLLDNADGWVKRYIPAKKSTRSTEDLGYIVRLDRPHPLFKFTDIQLSELSTTCNEEKKLINVSTVKTDINANIKVGASIQVEPKSKLSIATQLLKFVGINSKINAEASASGDIKFNFLNTNKKELSYGVKNGSWEFKTVRVDRLDEENKKLNHYATILIKKVFKCEALEKTHLKNASFKIFLGDYGVPVDFNNPLPLISLSSDSIKNIFNFKKQSNFPSLISIGNQDEYEKAMNYFQLKRGLTKAISAYIIKEINRSHPFD